MSVVSERLVDRLLAPLDRTTEAVLRRLGAAIAGAETDRDKIADHGSGHGSGEALSVISDDEPPADARARPLPGEDVRSAREVSPPKKPGLISPGPAVANPGATDHKPADPASRGPTRDQSSDQSSDHGRLAAIVPLQAVRPPELARDPDLSWPAVEATAPPRRGDLSRDAAPARSPDQDDVGRAPVPAGLRAPELAVRPLVGSRPHDSGTPPVRHLPASLAYRRPAPEQLPIRATAPLKSADRFPDTASVPAASRASRPDIAMRPALSGSEREGRPVPGSAPGRASGIVPLHILTGGAALSPATPDYPPGSAGAAFGESLPPLPRAAAGRIGRAIEPLLQRTASFDAPFDAVPDAADAARPDGPWTGTPESARATFNVSVNLAAEGDPDALRDALVAVLRDSARRHGLDV
jgi:hypothetical protein